MLGGDLAESLERLTANAEVATVLGSIPSQHPSTQWNLRGGDEAVMNIVQYKKRKIKKNPPLTI
jgi:hypothetical protein